MRQFYAGLAGLLLLGVFTPLWAQEAPLRPFTSVHDFETGDVKMDLWAHNGSEPVINFNGVTEERAAGGKRSFKLDVALGDGSYYYFGVREAVPCAGELKLSAKVFAADGTTARVGFGTNMVYPPTHHSGCAAFKDWGKPTADWEAAEDDLVAHGKTGAAGVIAGNTVNLTGESVGVVLDRWGLFLYGSAGQRAIVYLDDVTLAGRVPEEAAYLAQVKASWDKATGSFRAQVKGWQQELTAARTGLGALNQAPPEAQDMVAAIRESDKQAETILAAMNKNGYAAAREISELQAALNAVKYGPETIRAIREATRAKRPMLLYAAGNSVTLARTPGKGSLLTSPVGGVLSATACRGEFESRSAMVYALRDLEQLKVSASALTSATGASIPASAVDIRIVKWWYQGASGGIGYSPKKALVPELLLKDDALVRVDTEKQENWLRSTKADGTVEYVECTNPDSSNLANVRPVDAKELQPVDIAAGNSREFWVNIHVPESAAAGTYMGRLTFTTAAGTSELPLRVTVNGFALQDSRLIYSIYYRARLAADGQPSITSETKSEAQFRAEIANLRDHGVLYPTNYQGWDEKLLRKVLDIRQEAGLPAGRFYNLGLCVLPQKSPEALASVIKQVKQWIALLQEYGYDQPYFYGIDEATGEMLKSQREAWAAAQEAGAKTFVACYQGTFEAMGKLLNCAVIAGAPDLEEVRKWHSVGSEIFCYANPQVGVEDAQIYRRNFGLRLWAAGYDGAMDYAYQHGFNHVWNDFDDKTYRDHNFTYPTLDGIVDTIAWEGFREGVDDVRYATTLECLVKDAAQMSPTVAAEARTWLTSPEMAAGNLDEARTKMAQWIDKLQAACGGAPQGGALIMPRGYG